MDPDRLRQIEHLYHAACELPPSQREAFLTTACGLDADLLSRVTALLAQTSGPMDQPVLNLAADLLLDSWTPGTQVGPYQIVSRIGEGGMGEVFQALDTRLGRRVAIKTAHQEFSGRFEREARAISALNHHNICALYDIGPNYLVMELVEGSSLAGPVPVDTAIDYARQLAAGLEAAHERGVVHRDLKPANIKITLAGTVKILDFGLAKAVEPPEILPPAPAPRVTEAGVVLGTAAYMSPEQARGQDVDRRTDIWAFGVVLYELLTGVSPFACENVSDSLAAVLTREPDFDALPRETPPRVRRLLEHCLRKDPRQRLRDIGDARLQLDGPESEAPKPRRRLPWIVAAVLAIALLAWRAALLLPKAGEPDPGAVRFLLQLPPGTSPDAHIMSTHAVPSPDGRQLVIVVRDSVSGKPDLWVRPIGSTSARRLEKTQGANLPFWSPDSQQIAFFAERKLKRVALSGGTVETVCALPSDTADGGTWNQEGVIVFASYGPGAHPLLRVPAAGGIPSPVTAPAPGEMWHAMPQFLPDGRHLLYFAVSAEPTNGGVYVQELGSSRRVLVMRSSTRGVWASPGFLLFLREGTLFAQRMNSTTFQLEGEPRMLAQDVAYNDRNGRDAVGASRNGVLVYRGGASRMRQLVWYNREGKPLGTVGQPGEFLNPALAPDGKSVAVLVGPSGKIDIWAMDLASGVMTRMTRNSGVSIASTPLWSPDGQRLAVTQVPAGIQEVVVASGKATARGTEQAFGMDWSPDGKSILCTCTQAVRLCQLFLEPSGARLQIIPDAPQGLNGLRFSPDGRYVAFNDIESGQSEVYVASFPTFAPRRKISSGGGRFPVWVRGGKEILYRAGDGTLMSTEVRTSPQLSASTPSALFKAPGTDAGRFTVTADGNRFLLNEVVQKAEGEKPDITVVLNWFGGAR